MIKFFGESPRYLLFTDDTNAVIIDKFTNMVDEVGTLAILASAHMWKNTGIEVEKSQTDLAAGALADLQVQVVVASARMYTIPKSAQAEAKKALEWRKEHDRGGTSVGLNTARTLANGGQIGIQKVRHIAKYFPRHEIDKKAKGWKPGDDNFPSNGRIAWALWGGDAAWRWASAIVESENKKAVRADGYIIESDGSSIEDYELPTAYGTDLDAFSNEDVLFVARTRSDEAGIDRLYIIDDEGRPAVWDDGQWDYAALSEDADIYAIDRALDEEDEDGIERSHIVIDAASSLIASAYLQTSPFSSVSIADLDPEEAALIASTIDHMDWSVVDAVLTAAGEAPMDSTPGEYTPEERAQRARKQVRDKGGKFASKGSRVVIGGDTSKRGNITKIDAARQSVTVQLDSGQSVDVPATETQKEETFTPTPQEAPAGESAPLDLSGIIGKPRASVNNPKAVIPNGLPALTSDQLGQVLADFPAWVQSQRNAAEKNKYTPPSKEDLAKQQKDVVKKVEGFAGEKLILGDLRKHPLYAKLFKKNPKYNLYYDYRPITSAVTTAEKAEELTPQTSDVQPMYMAIVSPEDPSAVFDLVAVVPASTTSTSPMTYKREDAEWVRDEQILSDLQSPTPPPVVPLDGDNLMDVLKQVDKSVTAAAYSDFLENDTAIVSAGGADRNRGQAEKLRHYWTFGRGALKIRWNTPGDWTRCYRHLMKYMGPRAKGYCSLRHKEMTGVWPGSKFNIGKKNKNLLKASAFNEVLVPDEEQVLSVLYMNARIADARSRVLTAGGESMQHAGSKFRIPLVIPEGKESGDGRKFGKGSIEYRELPLPLLWQVKTADGHDGSVVVGRIDHMERTDDGIGNAYGVFDVSEYGKEAERMVRDGFIRGVSADLDKFEANEENDDESTELENKTKKKKKIGGGKINIDHARVMAVTIVPKPAFQECRIYLEENTDAGESQEADMTQAPDGIYAEDVESSEAQAIVACGMIAGAIPAVPPADWFVDPKLKAPTPLTVSDDGRVFGHIAAWHVDHIGMTAGTKPPRSKSKYAYFHTGVVRADNGKDYPVGQLTLAGGHASLEASAIDAARHYDDTGSAIADVHAGEDAYGIWVAGGLRPAASPEQIRALRASAPSGDWRPIGGQLELVAVCQVNVPGFPIARARVASGQVYALVAAGAQVLAKMKNDPVTELLQRVTTLESKQTNELSAKANSAKQKFAEIRASKNSELSSKAAELSARVRAEMSSVAAAAEADTEPTESLQARIASAAAEAELATISLRARKRLASEGKALPDGSYPIRNEGDLKNAIQAFGRSKKTDRPKVRRHIVKRARALGKYDVVPKEWKSAAIVAEDAADLRAQVASAKAALESKNTEKTES